MCEAEPTYRPATSTDHGLVQQTLYLALAWDPADPMPPMDAVVSHWHPPHERVDGRRPENGIHKISLRVSRGAPAAHLYERPGYRYVANDDEELLVLDLDRVQRL